MRFGTFAGVAGIVAVGTLSSQASASEFDERGVFSFATNAAHTESFEDFPIFGEGGSYAYAIEADNALDGTKVLKAQLREVAQAIPLTVPAGRQSYRLSYWIEGDCTGGLAVDYDDGRPGALAQAFPTGRVTSDGWVELLTAPLPIDGDGAGLDLRMYLAGYDGSTATNVKVDAVELVPVPVSGGGASCEGLDLAGACGADEMCLGGNCHPAAGWFPPLPNAADRDRLVDYWKEKIRDTYGPFLPRKLSMPEALDTLERARLATSAVAFWSQFAEAIRRLRDAHTYTRSPSPDNLIRKPMNVCFFEGIADLSKNAWPSDLTYHDILVSHVGKSHAWGIAQGDRLVAVDGVHPIAWARSLMSRSLWYWESDEPLQFANIVNSLQYLIPLYATTVTVVHCDASTDTCDAKPEVIEVRDVSALEPGEEVTLVGCDNRPFYHVPDAPEDHSFFGDEEVVAEGWLSQSSPEEGLRGMVWNSLYGGWPDSPLDAKLRAAVDLWTQSASGVVQDHREGHGGTSATANILVGFSREQFVPMVGLMRDRENDEGPQTPDEGKMLFDQVKGYAGERAGSDNPQTHIPVAMLLTWDVSASDFLPYMLKGAPQVRLFGPGPTMGAFGTFFQYSYWGGLTWSIGAQDSMSPEGLTLCGRGVYPDEIVLPKQSDLLEGKDTIHEAALSWLRAENAQ
jgi:hypothetical protein